MIDGNQLIEAAQAVVDRWDSPLWKDEAPTAEFIGRLRKALAGAKPQPASRELLQQALKHISTDAASVNPVQYTADCVELQGALEAELSRHEWVPVAERLPVVPEGRRDVCIWVYGGQFKSPSWVYWHLGVSEQLTRHFTHWMYRQDDTPAPPRSES